MKTTPVMLTLDKTRHLGAILLLILCSSHALAQKITSDFDKATDFTTFKTYAWAPGTASAWWTWWRTGGLA